MHLTRLLNLVLLFFISSFSCFSQDTLRIKNTEAILYLGNGLHQPLIVGLGGSEGGNAWSSNRWKKTRDLLISKGYAFLAIGYFGSKGTPPILNRIAIDDIHGAIREVAKHKAINNNRIAIIGGSRGADLALLLGSYCADITCVVGLVPSHVTFPGHTQEFNSSCWTYQGKELPYVPINEPAVPFLMKSDLRGAFLAMLQDSVAEQRALINVEKINGPILLLSATRDEICPSTLMSEKMIHRLKHFQFKHHYEHIAIDGMHAEPLKHFDTVFEFLDKYFPSK